MKRKIHEIIYFILISYLLYNLASEATSVIAQVVMFIIFGIALIGLIDFLRKS
ncbi:Uncharacterised protein [Alysiella crassa]|uniref:Uncharacterized protein n=1 Tax=Alysiella crassa TaxID=153491 RepID=A0A376BLD1_9NEIS|nr:Uncharacterised protein [Alysiella crassa]